MRRSVPHSAPRSKPDGFALVIAIAAILLGSALMMSAFGRVRAHGTVARAGTMRRLAATVAETAAWTVMTNTNVSTLREDPIGTVRRTASVTRNGTVTVTLARTGTTLVWIVADASILRGAQRARYRVGVTVTFPRDTTLTTLVPIPGRAWVELF